MPTARPGARLLPLALAVAAVVLAASPAAAHTQLVGTSVARDAVVPAGTAEVVLSFSGGVRPELSTVVVTGPDGDGSRGRLTNRGDDVVQPLASPLTPGAWTLSYRVVAADGHPLTGTLPFTVAPGGLAGPASGGPSADVPAPTDAAATEADPAASAAASALADGMADSEGDGAPAGLPPVALPVAGLGAAGLLGLVVLRRRSRP